MSQAKKPWDYYTLNTTEPPNWATTLHTRLSNSFLPLLMSCLSIQIPLKAEWKTRTGGTQHQTTLLTKRVVSLSPCPRSHASFVRECYHVGKAWFALIYVLACSWLPACPLHVHTLIPSKGLHDLSRDRAEAHQPEIPQILFKIG